MRKLGDGQVPGAQLEPKPAEAKAEVPAHAQRMSSLLAADKEDAPRNMLRISLTLDVSKLSGWLNADASCRVEIGGHATWEEVRPGRSEGVGWRRRNRHARGGPDSRLQGGQGTRGAHVEHVDHGRDLGRVEAERLVERRRGLPSRKAGMRCRKKYGPGGVRALGVHGGDDASGICTGRARLKAGGARARAERTPNICSMVVTLDVSKLSGWLNASAPCRVERRA